MMQTPYLKTLGLWAILAVCMLPLQAQEAAKASDEQAVIKKLLYDMAEAYQSLPQTKNKQSVLKYFSPEATSTIFVFNISGRSRVQNSNVKGYGGFMDNLLRSSDVSIGYKIADVIDIEVNGSVASAVYKVAYEIKEADGIWVKGKEIVTLALEKIAGNWKIVHYTYVQMEDEKLKGTCLCELFIGEGDNNEVVSKTTVPSGQSYSTKFDNFEFRTIDGNWLIKVQDMVFKRAANGMLFRIDEEGETEVGVANSKREVVLMIIRGSLYKDSCARLRTS